MEYENAQLEVGVPLVVWRASLSLSLWLDENELLKGKGFKRALELGSGTGLLGLYTAKRLLKETPDSHLTFTDMEQSVSSITLT